MAAAVSEIASRVENIDRMISDLRKQAKDAAHTQATAGPSAVQEKQDMKQGPEKIPVPAEIIKPQPAPERAGPPVQVTPPVFSPAAEPVSLLMENREKDHAAPQEKPREPDEPLPELKMPEKIYRAAETIRAIKKDPQPEAPVKKQAQQPLPPTPRPRPAPVFEPREPAWIEVQVKKLLAWLLTEGNIWVTIGVILFLAGFGLLFSYAAQMGWVSIELRLAGSAVIGIGMTVFGWRQREKKRTYALILQGGGIGILYIVLLAAAKLGSVIPAAAAIIGMLMLSVFTVVLAVMQDFEPLALFALLGGYASPLLISTGSSNFVALFSIYTLLNFEILLLTAKRDWRKVRWEECSPP